MRFRTLRCVAVLVLSAAVPGSTSAQCGAWQEGFGSPGPDSPFLDFVTFDDGTGSALYACGNFRSIGSDRVQGVVRWNGSRWEQVGSGLHDISTLGVFDDGTGPRLVAGGSSTTVRGAIPEAVVRWNGSQWIPIAGLPSGASASVVIDLVEFDDGSGPALYVTGGFLLGAGGSTVHVARWRNGGWSDASVGLGASTWAGPLAVFDAGSGPRLYLGTNGAGPSLAFWNGSGWSDAAPGFTGVGVNAMATFAGVGPPALFLAGNVVTGGPYPFDGITRFDGTNLTPVGSGLWGDYDVRGEVLTVHDFGSGPRLVIGGRFDSAGGVRSRNLAAWNGVAWEGLAPGFVWGSDTSALASFDDGTGPALFVAGRFSEVSGTMASWAARFQHGTWSRFAQGNGFTGEYPSEYPGGVTCLGSMVVNGETNLVAAGGFQAAGTASVSQVARFDGSSWHAIGSSVPIYDPRAIVQADLGSGTRLYLGGGSSIYTHVAVASWDGTSWSPTGPLAGAVEELLAYDDGTGMALYAAGELVGGDVQRWTGASWQSLGVFPGYNRQVFDLCVHDDGSGSALYAAGQFSSGQGVARWNGTRWVMVAPDQLYLGAATSRLLSFDDGSGAQLYVGGPMGLTHPPYNAQLARWNGTTWTGIVTNGLVRGLTAFHDGVAPRLTITRTAGAMSRVSKLVGTQWVNLAVVDGFAMDLETFDGDRDAVPELFLAGYFRTVEAIASVGIARYVGCATAGTIECAGDGSATPCPCGNTGATGHGCANSVHASGARLANGGLASITADTLHLDAEAMTGSVAIFAQGTTLAGGTGIPFQDGLLCTGGVVTRLGSETIAGGFASFPNSSGPTLSQLGLVTMPGQRRVYQAIYRNQASFCTSGAANATNGLQVTWSL